MALEFRFSLPGQSETRYRLATNRLVIGRLPSNHLVLPVDGIEGIHAIVEADPSGSGYVVTDLGSEAGVKLNGGRVDVEARLKPGDRLQIGTVMLMVSEAPEPALPPLPRDVAPPPAPNPFDIPDGMGAESYSNASRTQTDTDPRMAATEYSRTAVSPGGSGAGAGAAALSRDNIDLKRTMLSERSASLRPKRILFAPSEAQPSGDWLEVVSYWGDTVIDVDHFHRSAEGYDRVVIGDPDKGAHFVGGLDDSASNLTLVAMRGDGYTLNLAEGMTARVRVGGKMETVTGRKQLNLARHDIAQIKVGALNFFCIFIRPPILQLPPNQYKDTLIMRLGVLGAIIYMLIVPLAWMSEPKDINKDKDDPWLITYAPEKEVIIKKETPPKPKVEVKPVEKPPEVVKPPPPKPQPIKPVKPIADEKPKPVAPTPAPQAPQAAATENLTKSQPKGAANKPPEVPKASPTPDHKAAGANANGAQANAKAAGAGLNQASGARKGKEATSVKGVEGVQNKQASGVNLSKLGVGLGSVLSKTGAGAIATDFKSAAGGAGGGSGSAAKDYGMGGGIGTGKSLGIGGSANAAGNNFGSAGGGGIGDGGKGGLGKDFGGGGRGKANISLPPGDPVISGGLTEEEILAVIRANLNQIRHCYEQLLQRSPSASGKVTAKFTIGLDGGVTASSIGESTIPDQVMSGCVSSRIQRWQFPRPRGGQPVQVSFPFVFNPV